MQTGKRTSPELSDIELVNLLVPPQKEGESQPVTLPPLVQGVDDDYAPDKLFVNAVAEIDTQPFKRECFTIGDLLEIMLLIGWVCCALVGSAYLAITYPHTLVLLYAKTYPAQLTATLDLPTRTLAPVTLTRSATAATTGHGHHSARAANGTLLLFNGSFTSQTIVSGTVYTGASGVPVATDHTVTINGATPGNPPQFGQASVTAHALPVGAQGNITAGDINIIGTTLQVRNAPFSNGRDAREYQAVAPQDIQTLTVNTTQKANRDLPQAFHMHPGEGVQLTDCMTKTTADHAPGDEATSVTVTTSKTCAAVAYNSQELDRQATAAFTKTRPAAHYHILGSVQTSIQSVSPFAVTLDGKWMYTFSPGYEQSLAEHIAGESPAQARADLLKTGVISDASIPGKLPPVGYIDFLVLVG